MKRLIFALAIVLVGCSTKWQKSGASEQDFQRDRYQCQMQTASAYPPLMVTSPATQGPSTTNCRPMGYGQVQCSTMPGLVTPGSTTDQNAIPRAYAMDNCLRAAGWSIAR